MAAALARARRSASEAGDSSGSGVSSTSGRATSKGSRSFAQWTRHKDLDLDVDATWHKKMLAEEARLEKLIQKRIDDLLQMQMAEELAERLMKYPTKTTEVE